MVETAFNFTHDVDVILFVIDGTSKQIGRGDSKILEKIKETKRKTILIINKIDMIKEKEDLLKLYNLPLDELLKESSKYMSNNIEFCSLINARNGKCSQIANTVHKALITAQILNHIH